MNDNKNKILLVALEKYLEENKIEKLQDIYKTIHYIDIFNFIKDWDIKKIIKLLTFFNNETRSQIFLLFSVEKQIELIENFSDKIIHDLFEELHTDESVDVLEEFPYKIVQKVLNATNSDTKNKINKIFTFAKHQCGFHMTVDFVSIYDDTNILSAKKRIKNEINKDLEIVGNIFVIDRKHKLVGYLTPEDILVSTNETKVKDLIKLIDFAKVTENIIKAEEIMEKFDVPTVPVVDSTGVLVGVIESNDIIEKYELLEESFLDFNTIKNIKKGKTYMETTSFEIFKSRFIWIIILLFAGSLTQIIVMSFQRLWSAQVGWSGSSEVNLQVGDVFYSTIIALALSTTISVVSSVQDSAGNSGSQSSSTLIRELAIDSISPEQYKYVFLKEFKAALMIGSVASIASFCRMFIIWGIMGEFNKIGEIADSLNKSSGWVMSWYLVIALIASFSFFVSIIIGNFIGVLLPIVAKKLNADGTVFSGPVQTTIVDVVVFTIYLSITTAIFIPLKYIFVIDNSFLI